MTGDKARVGKQRPYLLRAMHEWMSDNDLTPHIVVDANREGLTIPREHVSDGKLILNLSFSATHDLRIGNEFVDFEARFGGVARRLSIPVSAVLGIYARETGQGMVFTDDDTKPDEPAAHPEAEAPAPQPPEGKPAKGPNLKIVK